jgi:hypothetical protein
LPAAKAVIGSERAVLGAVTDFRAPVAELTAVS